nr:hypothetical protein [Bacillus sp. MRMR6]
MKNVRMTFLEKIKPCLISKDLLIQETVLHALHDFPYVPEEWTIELLEKAFLQQSLFKRKSKLEEMTHAHVKVEKNI